MTEEACAPVSSLAAMIQRDFGLELPVGGGQGSPESPYEITVTQPTAVGLAINRLLLVLGLANEWAWRLLSTQPVPGRPDVLRVHIQRVLWLEEEVVTETAAYDFQFAGDAATIRLRETPGCADPASGLAFPFEVGWLHYLGTSAAMPTDDLGIGHAAAFGAPGTEVTVYIYPGPQTLDFDAITDEFERCQEAFLLTQPTMGGALNQWGERSSGEVRYLYGAYRLVDLGTSVLILTTRNGHFVKIRVTFSDDETVVKQGTDSLEDFVTLIHSRSRQPDVLRESTA
jgi:hypothetical protein